MRSLAIVLLSLIVTQFAHAGLRQSVSCVEKKRGKNKIEVKLSFDPSVARETVWKKDAQGRSYVETYKVDKTEGAMTTTTKVSVAIPASYYRTYSGTYRWSDFYDINTLEEAGSGYSDMNFDGKEYRAFHGHDKNMMWDMMVYLPNDSAALKGQTFPGLLAMQMDIMDQGYYFFDLECTTHVRNIAQ